MGMFDNVRCKYPLPIEGANALEFQTKDTSAQQLDFYEIREDGTLWHEEYDIEDRSDPNAKGLDRFLGCMSRVNKRWVFEPFTGELCFYTFKDDDDTDSWIEFSALFWKGELKELKVVEDKP